MTPPPCFACRVRAAGNDYAGSYSAFCLSCQPHDQRPVFGGAWMCPVCAVAFGRLKDHDAHQIVDYGKPRAVECIDPAEFGDLTRDENGTWQTRAGLVKRARDGERLRAARQAHSSPLKASLGRQSA